MKKIEFHDVYFGFFGGFSSACAGLFLEDGFSEEVSEEEDSETPVSSFASNLKHQNEKKMLK